MNVFLPWMLSVGMLGIRDIRQGDLPVPSEFVAASALFAALSVVGSAQPELAGVLAWGVLIAIGLAVGEKTGSLGGLIGSPGTAVSGAAIGVGGAAVQPKAKAKKKGGK